MTNTFIFVMITSSTTSRCDLKNSQDSSPRQTVGIKCDDIIYRLLVSDEMIVVWCVDFSHTILERPPPELSLCQSGRFTTLFTTVSSGTPGIRFHTSITTSTVYWCIASKLKAPRNFYWMSNMFLWVEIFLFFVCYHVVPKRHSQLDCELNGL